MNAIVERAKNIILTPKTEWPVIAVEPATIPDLYRTYVIPLAAIPAIAGFIGLSLVGVGVPGVGAFRVPIVQGAVMMLVQFGLGLAGVYILALLIAALAPTFGGRNDVVSGFKVAAYAYTPAWLAGVFAILPVASVLGILGLYSLYLLYLGLPRVMGSQEDKSLVYTIAVVVAGIVIAVVISAIAGLFMPAMPFGRLA